MLSRYSRNSLWWCGLLQGAVSLHWSSSLKSEWTCHPHNSSCKNNERCNRGACNWCTAPIFQLMQRPFLKIRTSALGKMANSNSVDFLVGIHSGLKRDYGSKTRERKNNDIKNCSFDVTRTLPLVVMLNCWGICIPPNALAVSSCRINVRIG